MFSGFFVSFDTFIKHLSILEIRTLCCRGCSQLRQHPFDASKRNPPRHRLYRRERTHCWPIQISRRQRYNSGYHIAYYHVCPRNANSAGDNGEGRKVQIHAEDNLPPRTHSSYGSWLFVSILS